MVVSASQPGTAPSAPVFDCLRCNYCMYFPGICQVRGQKDSGRRGKARPAERKRLPWSVPEILADGTGAAASCPGRGLVLYYLNILNEE